MPKEIRNHIRFKRNGVLKARPLKSVKTQSSNFKVLSQLVNDKRKYHVNVADGFKYKTSKGEILSHKFKPFDEKMTEKGSYTLSTGKHGHVGQMQSPGNEVNAFNSPSDDVFITINDKLNEEEMAETFAHEAYGHAYLFSIGEDYKHETKNIDGVFKDKNKNLYESIMRAVKETINYMKGGE